MARGNFPLQTFNRGRISRLALGRTDLDRTRLSAEQQTNWMPRTIGSMMLRPGLGYIGATLSNAKARPIPFIFSTTDTALVEVSSGTMRVWVDDAVVTRVNSTAAVTNGTFDADLTGWTDADETGSTSAFVTGGYMGLTGTRFARAIRRQTVTSSSGDHGLAVSVERGRPVLKVGSSAAGDDYFAERELRPGNYSLKITSTGNFSIELAANTEYTSLVDSVTVESSGDMTLTAPWASTDLANLRWKQSADVIFVAAKDYQQRRIERYDTESWALVVYDPENGPFRAINTTNKRLNPSALSGNITLACDQPLFDANHVGALFEVTSVGQNVEATITGGDQFSDAIRVSGVAATRIFDVLVTAISSDITVRVQRSIGEEGNWGNVTGLSWSSTVATTHDDGLDNQIAFYRIGSGSTDYNSTASGTASVELNYASGGITGIARIVSVPTSTESSAIVLTAFGSTGQSELWSEGDWSNFRGWPTAGTLHEGRMTWAGKSKLWASVSDAFENFDADTVGDSGPINKTIGEGPIDTIEWLLSLTRLMIGAQGQEFQAKTSSLEEPLTPTNFSLRDIATQGSAGVQAVKVDQRAYFVQQGGTRVFEIGVNQASLEFDAQDRTILVPEIGEPSIVRAAVQRQPDTRLHCVRSDGTVGVFVRDPAENVLCWIDVESSGGVGGAVEDVAILPGTVEDKVYYLVRREIDGSTKRYLEKWAQESESRGGSTNKLADSHIVQASTATTVVTGLDHLVGSSVIAWGATADLGSYTVSSTGTITLSQASTNTIVGLPYSALFKSAKLAYAADAGTALTQKKKIDHIGVVAADMHALGLQYGPSTDRLSPLPAIESSGVVSTDSVWSAYDAPSFEFDGKWDTDSRLVLYAQAPRPCTVLAAIITQQTKDKI